MKCAHCSIEIHPGFNDQWISSGNTVGEVEGDGCQWKISYMVCPACTGPIFDLLRISGDETERISVYPKVSLRPAAPAEVPTELADDFNEACLVLLPSPKASAALSRRCFQRLLAMKGYEQKNLDKAIEAVLASKSLPSSLAANLDAIRNIGNFAAHPIKETNSGAIVEVEPEEAEWNLDVLEGLFDFYFVQPARDRARIDALNVKLAAAGKTPMKQ